MSVTIQNRNTPQFLTERDEKHLLRAVERLHSERTQLKYRLIILIMLDCGARISEVIRLQLRDIDPQRRILRIESLKKRQEGIYREIPMTTRLVEALAKWWMQLNETTPDSYLFPADSETGHINRNGVWKVIKRISDGRVHPHLLRHTFATKIVRKTISESKTPAAALVTAKELLGHTHLATTEIYLHASQEEAAAAIRAIDKQNFFVRLYRKIVPAKRLPMLAMEKGMTKFHVGRREELAELVDLCQKKVNIYLTGERGIGKSHLLDNLEAGGTIDNILRIDDLSGIRKTLQAMVITLFNGDKEDLKHLIYGTDKEAEKIVTKESTKRLTELLCEITQQDEYTIVVDDATRITPTGVTALEKLANHFHVIIAARRIKLSHATFLSNFQKIKLQPLSRPEAVELITRASNDFHDRIEDFELFKTHVWRNTNGNPLYTLEMIDRFRREVVITADMLTSIKHTAALREWDMSLPLIIMLSSLMVLRYIGGEMGDDSGAYRLIGGAFLVFALFARNIFRAGKRKFA